MSWLDTLGHLFAPSSYRSAIPIEDQLITLRRRYETARPWRDASVDEALGVPAIFGAVSLIANTVGSLSMEAYRAGSKVDSPRLIVRPNPFSTPRDFFRDTAFYLASRGEAWWWVAARDIDDSPLSLFPIPPWEIIVSTVDDRLRPEVRWHDKLIPNRDIRHITYLPGQGLRGVGPLQLCGAAVSVTVEAQEWAANFFSGSVPSIIGTTDQDMSEDEMAAMDRQWNEKSPNMPRWLTNGLTMTDTPFDAQKAQLTESRQHQVGDAARMFDMPGALIEYQMGGSSLTYQNQSDIWNDFQRRCLSPHYLEPIEQTISDLLTRSTVARFSLEQLLRADVKTRFEVYEKAVTVFGEEEGARYAREREGLTSGGVDFAPVPFAPPQAVPSILPGDNRSMMELRCPKCGRLNGRASGYAETNCKRCGTLVVAA